MTRQPGWTPNHAPFARELELKGVPAIFHNSIIRTVHAEVTKRGLCHFKPDFWSEIKPHPLCPSLTEITVFDVRGGRWTHIFHLRKSRAIAIDQAKADRVLLHAFSRKKVYTRLPESLKRFARMFVTLHLARQVWRSRLYWHCVDVATYIGDVIEVAHHDGWASARQLVAEDMKLFGPYVSSGIVRNAPGFVRGWLLELRLALTWPCRILRRDAAPGPRTQGSWQQALDGIIAVIGAVTEIAVAMRKMLVELRKLVSHLHAIVRRLVAIAMLLAFAAALFFQPGVLGDAAQLREHLRQLVLMWMGGGS